VPPPVVVVQHRADPEIITSTNLHVRKHDTRVTPLTSIICSDYPQLDRLWARIAPSDDGGPSI
jgi:hypothetical protein